MNAPEQKPPQAPPAQDVVEETQQGTSRSPARDDLLKRQVRQHPQRDEPKVDSVEPFDLPPP